MVGSTDIEGSMKVTGTLQAGGIVELRKTAEVIQTLTGATGTIDHDTTASALFVHWGMLANFTANFTGLSTLDDRSWSMSLILNQGATPYIANAVEIDGAAQSINWAGGSPPSGTANYVDVINFTLVRTGSSWIVLGSLTTFN
jgi:hypothetical protein